MKRTVSSDRPRGARSISISVTKPYLYFSPMLATCSRVSWAISPAADDMITSRRGARTGARGKPDQGGDNRVAIAIRRIPAETDPHRGARQFVGDAHGRKHMRGRDFARGTGRAGTDLHPIQIESDHHVLGFEPRQRQIGGIAQPRRL